MIKLSDYVFKYLAEYGVKDVFMLSGGGCMHLVNSVGTNPDINYYCCLFEQAVSLSADAYAQYTGDIGVGLVTTGPGGTNAITGVAAAWTDSIPLLMISGQVKTSDISGKTVRTLGYQELDIVSIVSPITKYAVTVMKPENIAYELDKCIYYAKTGRPGPVWIDIPLDIQASMIDESSLKRFTPEGKLPANGENKNVSLTSDCAVDNDACITKTLEMIKEAKRPVIIAGYGIRLSNSVDEFVKLADILGIPVLTTWKAMDIVPEDYKNYYGRPGNIGQRAANFIQQNSDLVITIGARLDFGQIGFESETFARAAKKIIVDVDPAELDKFKFNIDLKVNMTAGYFINSLLEKIYDVSEPLADISEWKNYCDNLKNKYPVITDDLINVKGGASSYLLMKLLAEKTDSGFIFTPGNSGACSEVFSQAYAIQSGQRSLSTNTLGSMGTGLPESIGGAIASGKKTICINGDGGFQMNIQELETIHRLGLPIKFFVLNNNGYGSIRNSQNNYFNHFYVGSEPGSGVTIPEFERIAYAYKLRYVKINDNNEMIEKLSDVLDGNDPVLCEVMISPEESTLPRSQSKVLPDGKMKSVPQEDLYPFLPREEFDEAMIIDKN